VNLLQSGEAIVYAQPLPTRFHDLLRCLSDGDALTPG